MPFQPPRELDPPSKFDYRSRYEKTRDGRESRMYQHGSPKGRRSRSGQRSPAVGANRYGAMEERAYRQIRDESRHRGKVLLHSDRDRLTEFGGEVDVKYVQDDRESRPRRAFGERFDTLRDSGPKMSKRYIDTIDLTADDDDLLTPSHFEARQDRESEHRGRKIHASAYFRDKNNSFSHAKGGAAPSQSVKPVADRSQSPHSRTLAGQDRHVAHDKIYDHGRDARHAPDGDRSMHRSSKRHLSPQHTADLAFEELPREKRTRHNGSAQPRMKDIRIISPTQSQKIHAYTQQQSHQTRSPEHSPQQPHRGLMTKSRLPSQRLQGLIDEESDSNDNGTQRNDFNPNKSAKRPNEAPSQGDRNSQIGRISARALSIPPYTNPLDLYHMEQEESTKQVRFSTPPRTASHCKAHAVNARPYSRSGVAPTLQGDSDASSNCCNSRPSAPKSIDNLRSRAHYVAQGEIAQQQNAETQHPPKLDSNLQRQLLQKCRDGIANVTKVSAALVATDPTEARINKILQSSHPILHLEGARRPVNGENPAITTDGDDTANLAKTTSVDNGAYSAGDSEHSTQNRAATLEPAGKVFEAFAHSSNTYNAAPVAPSMTAGVIDATASFDSDEPRTESGSTQPSTLAEGSDVLPTAMAQHVELEAGSSRQESEKLARTQAEAARKIEAQKAPDEVQHREAKVRTAAQLEKQQKRDEDRSRWLTQLQVQNSGPLTAPAPAYTSILGSVQEHVGANVRDDPRQPKMPLTKGQRELQKITRETEKRNRILREQQRQLRAPSNAQLNPNAGPMSLAEAVGLELSLHKLAVPINVPSGAQQVEDHENDDNLFVSQQADGSTQSVAEFNIGDAAAASRDKRAQEFLDRGKQKRSNRAKRAAETRRASTQTPASQGAATNPIWKTTKLTSLGATNGPQTLKPRDDEFIIALRREGKPFEEISRQLKARSGTEASVTTIRDWYRKLKDDGVSSQSENPSRKASFGAKVVLNPREQQLLVEERNAGKSWKRVGESLSKLIGRSLDQKSLKRQYIIITSASANGKDLNQMGKVAKNAIAISSTSSTLDSDGEELVNDEDSSGGLGKTTVDTPLTSDSPLNFDLRRVRYTSGPYTSALQPKIHTTPLQTVEPFVPSPPDTPELNSAGFPTTGGKSIVQVLKAYLEAPDHASMHDSEAEEGGDGEQEDQGSDDRSRHNSPIGPRDQIYWAYRIMRKTWRIEDRKPHARRETVESDDDLDESPAVDPEAEAEHFEITHPGGPCCSLEEANQRAGQEITVKRHDLDPSDVVNTSFSVDEAGMNNLTLRTHYGATKVWVEKYVMTPACTDYAPPSSKARWVPRTCYVIMVKKTPIVDDLFDDPSQLLDKVWVSTSDAIYTILGQANKAAAILCVGMIVKTVGANPADSPKWCAKREELVAEANKAKEEGKVFDIEFDHWNGKTKVNVWVKEGCVVGPRNFE